MAIPSENLQISLLKGSQNIALYEEMRTFVRGETASIPLPPLILFWRGDFRDLKLNKRSVVIASCGRIKNLCVGALL